MTQELDTDHKRPTSFVRKVLRVIFWPVRHWKNAAITIIVLVILHTVVDQVQLSRLASLREAARAAGQAGSLTEFQLKDLTDDKNAAVVYRYARSLFRTPEGMDFDKTDIWSRYALSEMCPCRRSSSKEDDQEGAPSGPLTAEEIAAADAYVAANEQGYRAIREASIRPMCQFGDYRDPQAVSADGEVRIRELADLRQLARAVGLRAVWEARHGDTTAAYEWARIGLHMANDLGNDPIILDGLVRIAMASIAMDSLATILCEAPWPDAFPEGLERELVQLADRRPFTRCVEGELCYAATSATTVFRVPRVFRPIFQTPILFALEKAESEVLAAMNEPEPRKRQTTIAALERKYTPAKGVRWVFENYKIMAWITVPSLLRGSEAFDRLEAQAQGARQALALKRYKQQHGLYPEQLQELVSPGMLDALPLDPFSGDLFLYRKEGEGFVL